MHGLILNEMKRFATTHLGVDGWRALLEESGIGPKTFLATSSYPDGDAVALVNAAARKTSSTPDLVLRDFGEFIVPTLLKVFGSLVHEKWRTLDLIENTETVIHKAVRVGNPGATPPELRCVRSSENLVIVTYSSERKMCSVAKGIIEGVASYFGEEISVTETACMHKGSPCCTIFVKALR